MNTNDVYKGFRVLSVSEVSDYGSTAIHLRHEESGLEVLKLLNDDSENCFAFAFRTPCENSTGVAHAIEHSVLCGSAAYPLKDPFIRLENQSVNSYLNAYTCSDHTVYPSSSPVKADFYNIFSVYADAVFFPQLKEGAFLQECHRLELDGDGNPVIQGVVYNEMKGNYASFEGVAGDALLRPLLEGSEYVYDYGGDPLAIPDLTYEAFKDYHRRYYCTANCLCFLYGDIPLEEELDFLIGHVTSRISSPGRRASYPAPDFSRPVEERVRAFAPAGEGGEDSRRVVSQGWRLSDGIQDEDLPSFVMQFSFLSELLWGDDSAPVSKKMLESKIGEAIAPYTGLALGSRFPGICFSMSGVKEGDEQKFSDLLRGVLEELAEKGVPKEDFDRTSMSFDFSNREIKRPEGAPYSLVLMRRAVRSWILGFRPESTLSYRGEFEALKGRIRENPGLISDLIRKYLLENPRRSLVSVDPSAEWEKERSEKEKAIAGKELARMGKEKVLSQLEVMRKFQQEDEDESCLPHLGIADLPRKIDRLSLGNESLDGFPFFVSRELTNGISYFELVFPFDVLEPEEYIYVSTLASLVSQVGTRNRRWAQMMSRIGAVSGAFGADITVSKASDESLAKAPSSPYLNRDIFTFRFKCLDEKLPDCLDLLSEYLEGMDFSDTDRLSDLLAYNANEAKASVLPEAHVYAMYRAMRRRSPKLAIREIISGLTSVSFAARAKDMDLKELAGKLESVYRKIISSGAVLHITAEDAQISKVRPAVAAFIKRNALTPLCPRPAFDSDKFGRLLALTEFEGEAGTGRDKGTREIDEVFVIPGTVAFDARCCSSSPYGSKDSIAEMVFSHCLSMTDLWDKVRTKGGAYGVFFLPNLRMQVSSFVTYRDPKPSLSLSALKDSLMEDGAEVFSDEEVEKAITGCYSSEITPKTPASKGNTAFSWLFTGGSNEDSERRVGQLLSIDKEDLRAACLRYRESFSKGSSTVILCPRKLIDGSISDFTGKIIALPL